MKWGKSMALDNKFIGQRIKKIRKSNSMTQEKFSTRFHLTQQTLSRYESGKTPIPHELLENIAEEFSIPLSYFFGIKTEDFSEEEWLLIEYYRKVDSRIKKKVFNLVKAIADNYAEDE